MENPSTIILYHIIITPTLSIFLKTLHILQKDTKFGSQNLATEFGFVPDWSSHITLILQVSYIYLMTWQNYHINKNDENRWTERWTDKMWAMAIIFQSKSLMVKYGMILNCQPVSVQIPLFTSSCLSPPANVSLGVFYSIPRQAGIHMIQGPFLLT